MLQQLQLQQGRLGQRTYQKLRQRRRRALLPPHPQPPTLLQAPARISQRTENADLAKSAIGLGLLQIILSDLGVGQMAAQLLSSIATLIPLRLPCIRLCCFSLSFSPTSLDVLDVEDSINVLTTSKLDPLSAMLLRSEKREGSLDTRRLRRR